MVRKLFIESILSPSIDGVSSPGEGASQLVDFLSQGSATRGSMIAPAVSETLKAIDDIFATTPAAARVLMAYICGMWFSLSDPFSMFNIEQT